MTFCAHTEVRLQANKDIICTISEPHTGEAVESFPVTVAASSLYTRDLGWAPQSGIAFGCCRYNDEPRERTFEVRNEGLFSFAFCIGTMRRPKALLSCSGRRRRRYSLGVSMRTKLAN